MGEGCWARAGKAFVVGTGSGVGKVFVVGTGSGAGAGMAAGEGSTGAVASSAGSGGSESGLDGVEAGAAVPRGSEVGGLTGGTGGCDGTSGKGGSSMSRGILEGPAGTATGPGAEEGGDGAGSVNWVDWAPESARAVVASFVDDGNATGLITADGGGTGAGTGVTAARSLA